MREYILDLAMRDVPGHAIFDLFLRARVRDEDCTHEVNRHFAWGGLKTKASKFFF